MKVKSIIIAALMVCTSILTVSAAKKSITGTVTCDGKGVAGVVVTDGINLTKTDAKGAYSLPTKVKDPHCQFVHISIPSGYEAERIGNAPQFFKRVDPKAKKPVKSQYRQVSSNMEQHRQVFLQFGCADLQISVGYFVPIVKAPRLRI